MLLNSKYLERRRTDVKTQNQERLDSGILTSLISQGPILCQASQLPKSQELGTLAAVTTLKLGNYSFCLTEYLLRV